MLTIWLINLIFNLLNCVLSYFWVMNCTEVGFPNFPWKWICMYVCMSRAGRTGGDKGAPMEASAPPLQFYAREHSYMTSDAFRAILTYLPTLLYYISLFSKIRWGLTYYLPTQKSDVIYECSPIHSLLFCFQILGPSAVSGHDGF